MTRSELMSRIRSRGNRSTELALASHFRRHHVTGWRRHLKVEGVDVDFVFPRLKILVFVDGCFWHACGVHTDTNRLTSFWVRKVLGNRLRDIAQAEKLTMAGWTVRRVWEHDL